MNICFISLDYPSAFSGGGVGTQMRDIARALIAAGHQVTMIDLVKGNLPEFEEDRGVKIYRARVGNLHWYAKKIPWVGHFLSPALRELEFGKAVYELVKRLHLQTPFDLIEGTETGSLGVALGLRGVPFIIRLHGEVYTVVKHTPFKLGLEIRLTRFLQRIALRKARMLIAVSQAHGKEIANELGNKHPLIGVIPNFIDLKASLPFSRHEEPGTILYVGRIEYRKGIPLLLKAAGQVVREFPKAHFILVGAAHPTLDRAEIDRLIQEYNLGGHVTLPGHIPAGELVQWYGRAAVCVLPSYYESFGISALESMAYGVPIVATQAGGLVEVVGDGVTGLLTPVGNADALAEALLRLLKNPALRKAMGEAGKKRVQEKFNPGVLAEKNIETYKRILNTAPKTYAESRHVFFSPHFDDGVFSCGGLIDSLKSENKHVKAITVFSGKMTNGMCSAFGRHFLSKWGLGKEFQSERLAEDKAALSNLRVKDSEYWEFPEAPYRHHSSGPVLYGSFEELKGKLHEEDGPLIQTLFSQIKKLVEKEAKEAAFYFPLSCGAHVDHQILFALGVRMAALGHKVRFYEDWPYAEEYEFSNHPQGWTSQNIDIRTENKLKAILEYKSQIKGLAKSPKKVSERARLFLSANGYKRPQERYWELSEECARDMIEKSEMPSFSFPKKRTHYSLRDFSRFLAIFRWHDLSELLPNGHGICLDLGCGNGRHREVVEKKGYKWVGLDKVPALKSLDIQADIQSLPIQSGKAAAVTAGQVLEYVDQLEAALTEIERVLEVGGIFCGSVSFLEPLHGKTLYGISPLALERLLYKAGFVDIQLKPGLCGFALMLWTWLRRFGGDPIARLAIPVTALFFVPLAALRFLFSWVWWRLGFGTGHGLDWIINKAPLEFAGHILFVARKPARKPKCISVS